MASLPYQDLRDFFQDILRMERRELDYIQVDDARLDIILKEILQCITTSDIMYRCSDNSLKYHAMMSLHDCLALSGRVYDYAEDVSFEMMFDQVLESACDDRSIRDEDFSFIPGLHGSELPYWSGVPPKLTHLILNLMAIHNNIRITEQPGGNRPIQVVDHSVVANDSSDVDNERVLCNVVANDSSDVDNERTIRNNQHNIDPPPSYGFLQMIRYSELGDVESTNAIEDNLPVSSTDNYATPFSVHTVMGLDTFDTDTPVRSRWFEDDINVMPAEDALDINF